MSTLNALAISIGVLAGVAVWLFLGPIAGALQIWIAFLAWGCFYHCGGGTIGFRNTVLGMSYGAILSWIAVLLILGVPSLLGSLGLALWAAIVVGVLVAVIVLSANFEPLSAIPATVYGFASTIGFVLLSEVGMKKPVLADVTSASLANPLIVSILSLIVGAMFGYVSEQIGNVLMGKSRAKAAA